MTARTVHLTEYSTVSLPRDELTPDEGLAILERYPEKVDVQFPTPRTRGCWELTSLGWVGFLPVSDSLSLRLNPKVPIGNLFRMLEWAYGFKHFAFLAGATEVDTLDDFVTELAAALANRVLARSRRGFYRAYVGREEQLQYVRGRIDVGSVVRRPWSTSLACMFEDHTSDVEENQIPAWALHCALASGRCNERALPRIRQAYQTVRSFATVTPHPGRACANRTYTRLNDDYDPIHTLSRFFIDRVGPVHRPGGQRILPFAIEMAGLFEQFVAAWLRENLPDGLRLTAHDRVLIGGTGAVRLDIDLVVERTDGTPLWVLDTKYKVPGQGPRTEDLYQVVAYAEAKGALRAGLIYPSTVAMPFGVNWGRGGIRVQTFSFDLAGDLEAAGRALVAAALSGA